MIYLLYQGRIFIYYFLEVAVDQTNIEKELKDVNENLEDVNKNLEDMRKNTKTLESLAENIHNIQGNQKQMEKRNEQRFAQVKECFTQLQGNLANPEVAIPGELYLVYLEYFHELCRQSKKFENSA